MCLVVAENIWVRISACPQRQKNKMSQIKEMILEKVRARNYPEVKRLLEELDEQLEKIESLQKFADEIKKLIIEKGKTNILYKSEIENLIEENKIR